MTRIVLVVVFCKMFSLYLHVLPDINCLVQRYLGFRLSPYSNNSVFDQKIRAKNASEFEQNFSVRTLRLGTEKSQVKSKRIQ